MRLDLLKTVTRAALHFSIGFAVTFALTGLGAISTGIALIEPRGLPGASGGRSGAAAGEHCQTVGVTAC